MTKYGMSMCVLGMAEDQRQSRRECAFTETTIATAAIEFALGGQAMMRRSRKQYYG